MRVADPQAFIKEIAGTNAHFVTEDIEGQLKRTLVGGFSDALGESKIAALDLASNYDELAKFTRVKLNDEFKTFGLELTKFVIENISLPQEVEAAMDKRTSMGVIGDVGRYAQFQAADAMRDAAQNPGGGAGTGVGLGAGFALGNAMAGAMSDAMKQSNQGSTRQLHRRRQVCRVQSVVTRTRLARSSARSAVRSKGQRLANCQAELSPGAKFCNECGQKV
jgi:membrane protease subunit (stomatin/prohibitin family)